MKWNQAAALAILLAIALAALVFSAEKKHRFTTEECLICHTDQNGSRENLRVDITGACATCHPSARNYQSHPTDFVPKMSLPGDVLLVDERFTCVSCHDVHDKKGMSGKGGYFLRRNISGKPFCLICHDVDDKGHLFIGATHVGQFKVNDVGTRIDEVTLLCLECHDDWIDAMDREFRAGTWNHFSGRLNHPIGVSYQEAYRKKPVSYVHPSTLSEEIELFEGKIGCGTCHNRFRNKRFMLVMANNRSKLCFSCHIK